MARRKDVRIDRMTKPITIHVFSDPLNRRRGLLRIGALTLHCAMGRSGVITAKREGDGGTPHAVLHPVAVYFRADRWRDRAFALPSRPIAQLDGWCDDVGSHRYNQRIQLPSGLSHENLWRSDRLYDIVIETDWNRRPAIRGRGSAIFIHLVRPNFSPTEGCIALDKKGMRLLLPLLHRRTRLIVH